MSLYEPDARFVARSGETIVGRDAIRGMLAELIAAKTRLQSRVVKSITVGDIAQLYPDFVERESIRQGRPMTAATCDRSPSPPAGPHVKLIVDEPNGRG